MLFPDPKFTLAQLQTFVTIAQELCYRKAAGKLHMAPSSLTSQMQTLEQAVGVSLFRRSRRAVSLTREGTLLLDEALELLAQAGQLEQLAIKAGYRKRSGEIVIGISRELSETAHQVAHEFLQDSPTVKLTYREVVSAEQCKALREHAIDVSFLRTPVRPSKVNSFLLFSQPLVAILPISHRLAAATSVTPRDLAEELVFVRSRQSAPAEHDQVLDLFRRVGVHPQISETTLSPRFVAEMKVALTQGIYILPEKIIETNKKVVAVKLDEPKAVRDVYLAWRPGLAEEPVKTFVQAAQHIFARQQTQDRPR